MFVCSPCTGDVCPALLPTRLPSEPGWGHHCSLLVFRALARALGGSRPCAPRGANSNQPQQEPGWEQGSGGDPQTTGQRVQGKNRPAPRSSSLKLLSCFSGFLLLFPARAALPGLLPLMCVEKSHRDV